MSYQLVKNEKCVGGDEENNNDEIESLAGIEVEDHEKLLIEINPIPKEDTLPLKGIQEKEESSVIFKGLILSMISAILLSVSSVLVKLGASTFSLALIIFMRGLGPFTLGCTVCYFRNIHPLGQPEHRFWCCVRGATGSLGLAIFYYAVTLLPVSDATVIRYISPILTTFLAFLILKEDFGWIQIASCVGCLIGVILVIQPSFLFPTQTPSSPSDLLADDVTASSRVLSAHTVGSLCSILAAVVGSFVFISIRKLGRKCHFMVLVVYYGLSTMLLGILGLAIFPALGYSSHLILTTPTTNDWVVLILLFAISFVDQVFNNAGAQMAPAGLATLMRHVEILSAYILQVIFFSQQPNALSVCGGILMIASMGMTVIWKWVQQIKLKKEIVH